METKISGGYVSARIGQLKMSIYVMSDIPKAVASNDFDSFEMIWDKKNFLFLEWLDNVGKALENMFEGFGFTIANFLKKNEQDIYVSFIQWLTAPERCILLECEQRFPTQKE